MADEKEKEEGAEEAKGKGKGKKKKLIMIVAAVAVILLGAGGFFVLNGKASPDGGDGGDHAAEDSGHGGGHGKSDKGGHGGGGGHGGDEGAASSFVPLDPFIVNLQDNSGTRYLKVTVNLELASGSPDELEAYKAKIRDSLIILLSSKSYSDIGTVEGKYRMRDEIVARVNQYLKDSKVETAYFTEFVIQ